MLMPYICKNVEILCSAYVFFISIFEFLFKVSTGSLLHVSQRDFLLRLVLQEIELRVSEHTESARKVMR